MRLTYTLLSAVTIALSTSDLVDASKLSTEVELVPAMSCCNSSGGVVGKRAARVWNASFKNTAPAMERANVIPESWPMICPKRRARVSTCASYVSLGFNVW